MGVTIPKPKTAWEERFRTPTIDALRAEYAKPLAALFDGARALLDDLPGLTSELSWQGVAWRWSLVYRGHGDTARPWVCLVPKPARPVVVIPFAHAQLAKIPAKKFSKYIRDGLVSGPEVAGVRWGQWELAAKSNLEDVTILVQVKHELSKLGGRELATA